jgi:SAM-dependent methyltransferase
MAVMKTREMIDQEMRNHYQKVWQAGDAWQFETSPFENERYEYQLSLLKSRHYDLALEIGCGSGVFTQLLARLANHVVALDIAEAAIDRARARIESTSSEKTIEFFTANAMEYDYEGTGPWDLIVLSETIYSLGWLYPFFDVAWFCHKLFQATRPGGRLLLANTFGHERDYLMQPWLIRTYRDLCLNVGYEVASEELFRGTKDGVDYEVLMSVLRRPSNALE